jgi:hypothetical protein
MCTDARLAMPNALLDIINVKKNVKHARLISRDQNLTSEVQSPHPVRLKSDKGQRLHQSDLLTTPPPGPAGAIPLTSSLL